jgi:hypothetical protein
MGWRIHDVLGCCSEWANPSGVAGGSLVAMMSARVSGVAGVMVAQMVTWWPCLL